MKKSILFLFIVGILLALGFSQAFAQNDQQLKLTLSRDFGYSGFNSDIQGVFTAKISNPPQNVTKVEFYIDGILMGEDTTAPFGLQFNTDSYNTGMHTLSAIGYTSDGTQINSNNIQVQFVPAGTGLQSVFKFIVPIILLIIVIALLAVFLPIVFNKGKLASTPLGEPRKYGVGGGAICPNCNRPFPLRLWWINLGSKKIDRCPYCGKWSMVRPRSTSELREAEAAELVQSGTQPAITEETEEEKLRRELDDSRFQDT
jgi:DNA-directed RNA polymerase subunit RPC12/RpoP